MTKRIIQLVLVIFVLSFFVSLWTGKLLRNEDKKQNEYDAIIATIKKEVKYFPVSEFVNRK